MNFSTIESINDAFYSNTAQRQYHLDKAKDILSSIQNRLGWTNGTILALGRSWLSEHLIELGHQVIFPNELASNSRFSIILAMDEILTKEEHEQDQRKHITQLVELLDKDGLLIASLRDFKNSNFHRRPLGDSCSNVIDHHKIVTLEVNDLSHSDKQSWIQKLYVTVNDNEFTCLNLGKRRTLYFKQLAKYCLDAGAPEFGVIKDTFWRNHLRRSPEHIVFARRS